MDVTESSSAGGSRGGGGSDEPPVVKPPTRNGYSRLAKVELQIADAVMLDGPAIVKRARQRDIEPSVTIAVQSSVRLPGQWQRVNHTGLMPGERRGSFERFSARSRTRATTFSMRCLAPARLSRWGA